MRSSRRPPCSVGVFVVVVATACLTGCTTNSDVEVPVSVESIPLPDPLPSDMSLDEALALRRSVREYTDATLSNGELSNLLWAAQGITRPTGARTAPSAGATYPLELYVATGDGLFRYQPDEHAMVKIGSDDLRSELSNAALGQDHVATAPVVFVFTAVYERTAGKYGSRAERYVILEVGHAAQNLLLEATALGLGGVPVGAFDDDGVHRVLGLPDDHRPLYIVPVGHPDA
ncbi:MAG: SagB/ThcOx family dehydrogenase [Actinomycetota bacterium]